MRRTPIFRALNEGVETLVRLERKARDFGVLETQLKRHRPMLCYDASTLNTAREYVMALQATPYKVSLDISDMDRGVYETVKVTVARHPSETELRLVARIIAYAIFYHEHLTFGRGLSETDDAALWQLSLDGQIEHWVDVGQPDADRITKSSRRAPRMSVLAYGNTRIWAEKLLPKVNDLKHVRILALPEPEHTELASQIGRNIHWGVMITDGALYVSDGDSQVELTLQEIKAAQ